MTTNLQASIDESVAQTNERILLGAFNDARLTIAKPITFECNGFRRVDAEGSLVWLEQYIAQEQATEIVFPEELVNAVRKTIAQVATSPQHDASQEFKSLAIALDKWLDKDLKDLPEAERQRAEQGFTLIPWDNLILEIVTPDRRPCQSFFCRI